jgi:hypothetical protein
MDGSDQRACPQDCLTQVFPRILRKGKTGMLISGLKQAARLFPDIFSGSRRKAAGA